MKNFISLNIKYLRNLKGLSQEEFAKQIGKKRSVIGSYENGDAEPSIAILSGLAENFGIPISDIIERDLSQNNTNQIYENANKSANFSANKNANSLQVSTFLANTDINFFNARDLQLLHNEGLTPKKVFISPEPAIAGSPGSYMSEGNEELAWFYMPFLPIAGHYGCFRVQGHSMEDYISEGSWVICRLLEEAHQVRGGKIHLVATKSDGVVIKRLHKGSKIDKEGILCYSDNPNYAPFVVQNEDVQAIWVVEMFLQREFPILSEKAIAVLEQYLENL